jgi:c-di-GMP-related signal transduction protein
MLAHQQAANSREVLDLQGRDGVAIPADAEAVAQLQLLASSHVVDLTAITEIIRNDAGLTVQLLQFSARKLGNYVGSAASVEELVVQLGLEQLQAMAAQVTVTPPISLRQ